MQEEKKVEKEVPKSIEGVEGDKNDERKSRILNKFHEYEGASRSNEEDIE
jgi:hypothetical protein